jgi:hypothetical protein
MPLFETEAFLVANSVLYNNNLQVMKKYTFLFFLVFASLLDHAAWSQSYAFFVISTKGMPEKRVNSDWSQVKIGEQLKSTDEVRVPPNGYLGLNHVSGKPLEIREPGNYKVADLAAKVSKGTNNMSKYTDFILSTEQEKKNKLAATGAVHRGSTAKIQVFLPASGKADLYSNYFILNWTSDGSDSYTVTVLDMLENQIIQRQSATSSARIDLADLKTQSQAILILVNSSNGNVSEKYVVRMLIGEKRKSYADLDKDLTELAAETNAINRYFLGNAYESRLLLIDALSAYKEAADLEPEAYGQAYKQFLTRMGYLK